MGFKSITGVRSLETKDAPTATEVSHAVCHEIALGVNRALLPAAQCSLLLAIPVTTISMVGGISTGEQVQPSLACPA